MKISYTWLKQYLRTDLSPEALSEILTDLGLEVEGIEQQDSVKGGLRGLVVGRVAECAKHPNADKLSVTQVDVGGDRPLEIVCGAPNVAAGQKVVVALEGATLYPTTGEPFTIKKGKIRGEVSEGMICAEDEIGLGESHAGIMVLREEAPVGQPAAEYFGLASDHVIEIGLTPNRSDATCHLGVSRDVAARLRLLHPERTEPFLRWPDMPELPAVAAEDLSVGTEIRDAGACPRYCGLTLRNVRVAESPAWLKNRLLAIGVRPINNVVDVTNFVLHELGQPLHAFDLRAVKGRKVIVQCLPGGTPFVALDGTERKLHAEDLMICDGEGTPLCMAGVFGGLHSGVSEGTTEVFLESAHFAARSVRRTSMRHLLRTDAATRFEKGTDPNLPLLALQRAAVLLRELAGAEVASAPSDFYPHPVVPAVVRVRYARIDQLVGNPIPPAEVRRILEALGMDIRAEEPDGLTVGVPTNKSDVCREVDVIEEILRVYGFNRIEFGHLIRSSLSFSPKPDPWKMRNVAADTLAAQGFLEMMSLSLTPSRAYAELLPELVPELVAINNTANQHLDVMRATMLFSGLEAIVHNQNRQHPDLRLFEFGRTYHCREQGGYAEHQHLSIFLTGRRHAENWLAKDREPVSFFTLKTYALNLLARLGITAYQQTALDNDPVFAHGLRLHRGKLVIAEFGAVRPGLLKKMDVRQPVFYADIRWETVLDLSKNPAQRTSELSKFPSVRRDLALVLQKGVSFASLQEAARKTGKELLREVNLFDVYENAEQLGADKKSYAVSFTFRDDHKTLKDSEVDAVMQSLMKVFEEKLGATVRR
jgi:phenylalanyl-tRNA synthetase beta chain